MAKQFFIIFFKIHWKIPTKKLHFYQGGRLEAGHQQLSSKKDLHTLFTFTYYLTFKKALYWVWGLLKVSRAHFFFSRCGFRSHRASICSRNMRGTFPWAIPSIFGKTFPMKFLGYSDIMKCALFQTDQPDSLLPLRHINSSH